MTLTNEQQIQGSPEWLELRRSKITASEIPIILGMSEYMTPHQLWQIKTGLKEPEIMNSNMKFGHENEENIRQWANQYLSCNFSPSVLVYPENEIIMASVDGIDVREKVILEAKTCKQEIFEQVLINEYPMAWYVQIQIQLLCAGYHQAYLVANHVKSDRFACVPVFRCDDNIKIYVDEALKFKYKVDNFIEPELVDADYQEFFGDAISVAEQYKTARESVKILSEIEEKLKKELLELTGSRNAKVGNLKIKKIVRTGCVNWNALLDESGIPRDITEKYRNPSTEYFKFSVE